MAEWAAAQASLDELLQAISGGPTVVPDEITQHKLEPKALVVGVPFDVRCVVMRWCAFVSVCECERV